MVKDRAYPRYVPQILMGDDPCVEGREFQFGEHRAEKRFGAAGRALDDRDADAGARTRRSTRRSGRPSSRKAVSIGLRR